MKRLWLSTLLCFLFFIVYPLAAERLPNYDYYSERFFQTATESLVRRKIADGSIRQYGQNLSIVLWKAIQYNRDPKVIKAILDSRTILNGIHCIMLLFIAPIRKCMRF
jgi:hypothetical protein